MSCPRPQRFLGTRLHPLLDLPHSARPQYVASASRLLSQHLRRRTPGVAAPEHVVCLIFLFGSLTCRASATGRDVEYCQSFFQNVTLKSVNGLLFPFLILLSRPLPNTVRYAFGAPGSLPHRPARFPRERKSEDYGATTRCHTAPCPLLLHLPRLLPCRSRSFTGHQAARPTLGLLFHHVWNVFNGLKPNSSMSCHIMTRPVMPCFVVFSHVTP